MVTNITMQPIGVIRSPFQDLAGMPIQPASSEKAAGAVEIYAPYAEGLKDLEGFSHIYLIYWLHKVRQTRLTVIPFLDDQPHGVFATRAPSRPNPIGLSLVELVAVKGNMLQIMDIDVLDGTPLLDIKPYVPEFEPAEAVRTGWLERARGPVQNRKSDERFT